MNSTHSTPKFDAAAERLPNLDEEDRGGNHQDKEDIDDNLYLLSLGITIPTNEGPSRTLSASVDAVTYRTRLLTLIDRFTGLLMSSTERLIRLRAVLKGLRDSLDGIPSSTPTCSASPLASPNQPLNFSIQSSPRISNPVDAAQDPPRLCITGVSDVDMDEVFQFLLHRDSVTVRGESTYLSHDHPADLHSANSAVRAPTCDSSSTAFSRLSPMTSGVQRWPRTDALLPVSLAAPPTTTTGGGVTAASVGSTTSNEANAFPSVSPTASAAMTASVSASGLFSTSNTTLSDGGQEVIPTALLSDFPTTPPPPTPELVHVATESRKRRVSLQPSNSPASQHFDLPALHRRFESGSQMVDPQGRKAKEEVTSAEGNGAFSPFAPHTNPGSYTVVLPTTAALRSPTTTTSNAARPRSLSPHPPLPAAPANHNLRAVKSARPLESRTLRSLLQKSGDGGAVVAEAATENSDDVVPTGSEDAVNAASLSSTMPDLGDKASSAAPEELPSSAIDASPPPPSAPVAVPHLPPITRTTTTIVPFLPNSGGAHQQTSGPSHPISAGELGVTPPVSHAGASAPFRCRAVTHHATLSSSPPTTTTAVVHTGEVSATPTPIMPVLHRTPSQHSESSDHQRSFVGSLPSTSVGRFNTLPTPFARMSGIGGASSSAGRSARDDSAVLSPWSSFSPAAARFVQRLRRRTVSLAPVQLRLTAWDLFHPDRLTEHDRALLLSTWTSFTAGASPKRVGRPSKSGLTRPNRNRSTPHLPCRTPPATDVPASALGVSALPWMVGINEDGVLRYEPLPNVQAPPPYTPSPPITTISNYCLVCIPFDAVCGGTQGRVNDAGVDSAVAATKESRPVNTIRDAEEVKRAMNLLFGPFSASKPQPRSVPPAASIFVTPESADSPRTATAGTAVVVDGHGGSVCDKPTAPLSSPPQPTLATGTPTFPALGRAGSGNVAGQRGSARLWPLSPKLSLEKPLSREHRNLVAVTAALGSGMNNGGAGLDSRPAHPQRGDPLRLAGLSSGSARAASTFLKSVKENLCGSDDGDHSSETVLPPPQSRGASHETSMEAWLYRLRQVMVNRAVFVLVKSEPPPSCFPPDPLPTPPPAAASINSHPPQNRSSVKAGGRVSITSTSPATHAEVIHSFVHFAKLHYGVTVPSWRVVVFSYRESVITRNFLLSYYADTHAPSIVQPAKRTSTEESGQGEVTDDASSTKGRPSSVLHSIAGVNGNPCGIDGDTPILDLRRTTSPPMHINNNSGHTPPDAVMVMAASLASQGKPRHSSRSGLIHSQRMNAATTTSTRPQLDVAESMGTTYNDKDSEYADDDARLTNALFSLLTKDITVPPLSTSMAAYASLMPRVSWGVDTAATMPPVPSSPTRKYMTTLLQHPIDADTRGAHERGTLSSPSTPAAAISVPSGVSGDASPLTNTTRRHSSSPAVFLSSQSNGRHESEGAATALTKEEEARRRSAACTHALKVMWRDSGAAMLSSAFRLFEHDDALHRTSQAAFSLMAWSWQLGALLPAIVRETHLRCRRLRHSRRRASQNLERLNKSIDMHARSSPAKCVAALEMRLQTSFAVMTQRFAHDVRRLLTAPSYCLPTEPAARSSPVSPAPAPTTFTTSSPTSQQHTSPTYPPMDALGAYETSALRNAYHRLAHYAQKFRNFYINGEVPLEGPFEEKRHEKNGMAGEAPEDEDDGERRNEETTGLRWNVSLYERRYSALCEQLEAPVSASSKTSADALQDEKWVSPLASSSASTRAASMSVAFSPPALSSTCLQSRELQSAPTPPRLNDGAGKEEQQEHQMPQVDRSGLRDRRVSLIARVSLCASATAINSSVNSNSHASSVDAAATAAPKAGTVAAPPNHIINDRLNASNSHSNSSHTPIKRQSLSEAGTPPPRQVPRKALLFSRAECQQRRLLMEHQLIAHVSQINTEIINFFLATCVAALPHIHFSCVQAELERVRVAHAEMYSAFATVVHNHKDAAMSMAHMYAGLEQWTAGAGPLLSMVHSRRFLEKFITQLRAVLCEDQIRGLAAYRRQRDAKRRNVSSGRTAQLTKVNISNDCTAIEKTMKRKQPEGETRKETTAACKDFTERSQLTLSADVSTPAAADAVATVGGVSSTEVGLRSAKLLLYYTRLACKPLYWKGSGADAGNLVSPTRGRETDDSSRMLLPTLRQGRSTSAASTVTSHVPISRRRGGSASYNDGGLGNTVSLTSIPAAWNREEDVSRNTGHVAGPLSRRPGQRHDEDAGMADGSGDNGLTESFYATPSRPCMYAVSASLMAALGASPGEYGTPLSAGLTATASDKFSKRPCTPLEGPETSHAAFSTAPASKAVSQKSKRSAVKQRDYTSTGTTGGVRDSDSNGNSNSSSTSAWRTDLKKWRARMSEAERPADIAAAPLLWMLLDTWDETLLRFPFGLLMHLDTARYAELLNALSAPVIESQLRYRARFTETAKNVSKQLTVLESDMKRLQDEDGELRADYIAALRSIFDDATALAKPQDEALHASLFSAS